MVLFSKVLQVDSSGNAVGDALAPRGRTRGLLTTATAVIPIPASASAVKVYCSTLARVGSSASGSAVAATPQRQTITGGDATSGNQTFTFQGQVTANSAYNISGANLVTALVALSSIGAGGVTLVSGGPLNTTPIVVEFAAGILDGKQPLLIPTTVDLAGGVSAASRLATVTESQAAANISGFVEAGTELTFALATTDAYLHLTADSGTGLYRLTWFS